MKRLFAIGAVALTFVAFFPDDASARRGGGGGFSRGAIGHGGGAGFRGAAMARGPAMSGFRYMGGRPGGYAMRSGAGRPFAARAAWAGSRHGWRHRHHRFHRGWPIFVGAGAAALGYYGYNNYYYDTACVVWDGYALVDVCYDPYIYGYPAYRY